MPEATLFFTFKDFLLADGERYTVVIDRTVNILVPLQNYVAFVCLGVISGVQNMGTLHNGFKCLLEKWIRHCSKACPAC